MSAHPTPAPALSFILPLASALVYVLGAMLFKRAADLGVDVWRTVRACNYLSAVVFAPLAFLGGTIPSWHLCWQPAIAALFFTTGQVFMLLALRLGDVSVATPVLGLKVPLVALFTTVILRQPIGAGLWTAAVLSSVAIALLNVSRSQSHHRVGATLVTATTAAAAYAAVDVLVQKWTPNWGAGRFVPLTMAIVAVLSVVLRPFPTKRSSPERVEAARHRWVVGGAICFATQGLMFVSAIALYGQATVANVLYSSRGLWSVVAVWLVGHWFTNREQSHGPRVLAWRFVGAALLMAAILIVVLGRH